MTPVDKAGGQESWQKRRLENGVILTPHKYPNSAMDILTSFALSGFSGQFCGADEIYLDTEKNCTRVVGIGDLACRISPDHSPYPVSHTSFVNWLSSNLALAHALKSDKGSVGSFLVRPVRIDGAAIHRSEDGQLMSLTVMERLRNKNLFDLRSELWPTDKDRPKDIWRYDGYRELADLTRRRIARSFDCVYGSEVYNMLQSDGHYGNYILENSSIVRFDVDGFNGNLSELIGDHELTELASDLVD